MRLVAATPRHATQAVIARIAARVVYYKLLVNTRCPTAKGREDQY